MPPSAAKAHGGPGSASAPSIKFVTDGRARLTQY